MVSLGLKNLLEFEERSSGSNVQSDYGSSHHLSQSETRPVDGLDQPRAGSSGTSGQSRAGSMSGQLQAGPADGFVQSGAESVGGNGQLGGKVSNHIHSGSASSIDSGHLGMGITVGYSHSGSGSHNDHGRSEAGTSLGHGQSGHGNSDHSGSTGEVKWGNIGHMGTPMDSKIPQHGRPVNSNVLLPPAHDNPGGGTGMGSGNPPSQTNALNKDILAQEGLLGAILLNNQHLIREHERLLKILLDSKTLPAGKDHHLLEGAGSLALEGLLCKGSLGGICGHGSLDDINDVLKSAVPFGKLNSW